MGLFSNQFANMVEWQEFREDVIFWKWGNAELKKSSRLVIRPGQDAIFLYNGRIEGIFSDEGNFELESQIIPFLSTLKGFKFGFNSGLRAEILFVNTKEFTIKWGTKNSINIPAPGMPGGMPIRAFGTFNMKVSDYVQLIDKIAGVQVQYTVDDVRDRVSAVLDQLLMKWIVKNGKDMFNLQANASEIAEGILGDLDYEMAKIGFSITGFNIANFSYPEAVQAKIDQNAAYGMVGDVDKYQRIGMTDAMGKGDGGGTMSSMAGMAAGMRMADQMFDKKDGGQAAGAGATKFCSQCGAALKATDKFCAACGAKT
jgi:membrane protease subunit (stomatin/prohibitin family)